MNPLSIFTYYMRNKRKALPVLGILTLAVFGISLTLVLTATIFDGVRAFVSPYYKFVVVEPNYNKKYTELDAGLRADIRQSAHLAVAAPVQTHYLHGTILGVPTNYALFGIPDDLMPMVMELTGNTLIAGQLPTVREDQVALHEDIAKTRGLWLGSYVGRDVNADDPLPGKFEVVGIIGGRTVLNLASLDRLTHGRTPAELLLLPKPGELDELVADLEALRTDKATFQTPAYWNRFVERVLNQYDALVTSLNVVIIFVLSLGVGLLNMIYFRQRIGEFGILTAIGFSRLSLLRRVTLEALVLTVTAWVLGMLLSVGVYQLLNAMVFEPQGTHLSIFNLRLLTGTLPIPVIVWLFSTVTILWQLTRLDPVAVIDRRD